MSDETKPETGGEIIDRLTGDADRFAASAPPRKRLPLLFKARVRSAVKAELNKKVKLAGASAKAAAVNDYMSQVTDELIEEAADDVQIPAGKLGDGAFLQWLIDNKDKIAAVVKLILAALGV